MFSIHSKPGFSTNGSLLTAVSIAECLQVQVSPEVSRCPPFSAESRWKSYSRNRWKRIKKRLAGVHSETEYRGSAEDEEDGDQSRDEADAANTQQVSNKRLSDHFRQSAASNRDTDQVDLQFSDEVISDGADPNCSDRYGQTVLHEVCRAWSVDVMRFFLDRGSDLSSSDQFGVTASHVASASDYEDMVRFSSERKADPSARTLSDRQTPLHYAAKNDAVRSIRSSSEAGAAVGCTDYKRRTPSQLAACMERSEAAQVSSESGANAGVRDSDGQSCITASIGRMSHVAQVASRQFHAAERRTRQEFFYSNSSEPDARTPEEEPPDAAISDPTTPLQVVVSEGKSDLIMDPVFLKLIQIKWKLYGRLGAWILSVLNFSLNVSWTTVAISVSGCQDSPDRYTFPQDWWRVLSVVLALSLTSEEVCREVQDIVFSRRKLHSRRMWMERRFQDDSRCSHPMWPQEKQFLSNEISRIHRMRGNYSQDLWNIFDWSVYASSTAAFGAHMADVSQPSFSSHTVSSRLFSVAIIFLWSRLMKHVRAFRLMGPFIVMSGNIVGDVMCFSFSYAEIFIPYACSFWIVFGGTPSVPSMQSVSGLLYSSYRITSVDEYEYAAMVAVDNVMAPSSCGTFSAASSISCINSLIASLTDTFQRVHDNSQANAVMQQAAVISQVEDSMPRLRRFYDNQYISKHCAPSVEACDSITVSSPYHQEFGQIAAQVEETSDQFLDLQRDMETTRSSRLQTEQQQEIHDLRYSPIQDSQTPQKQELQEQMNQENLMQQSQSVQEPQNSRQELTAIQAELRELRSSVQQSSQIRKDFV